jgi:hypothetical protein
MNIASSGIGIDTNLFVKCQQIVKSDCCRDDGRVAERMSEPHGPAT